MFLGKYVIQRYLAKQF